MLGSYFGMCFVNFYYRFIFHTDVFSVILYYVGCVYLSWDKDPLHILINKSETIINNTYSLRRWTVFICCLLLLFLSVVTLVVGKGTGGKETINVGCVESEPGYNFLGLL